MIYRSALQPANDAGLLVGAAPIKVPDTWISSLAQPRVSAQFQWRCLAVDGQLTKKEKTNEPFQHDRIWPRRGRVWRA